MLVHVVLFRPRAEVGEADREALLAALRDANARIPSVRRFMVGRKLADPPSYVLSDFPDFPYLAAIEFDDRAGLDAYLVHEAHAALGRHFNALAEAALIYDFEVSTPDAATAWAESRSGAKDLG